MRVKKCAACGHRYYGLERAALWCPPCWSCLRVAKPEWRSQAFIATCSECLETRWAGGMQNGRCCDCIYSEQEAKRGTPGLGHWRSCLGCGERFRSRRVKAARGGAYCSNRCSAVANRRYRATRVQKAGPGHTPGEWRDKLSAYGGLCAWCGQPANSKDHVIPLAAGGSHHIDNIVPACLPCNSSKGDRPLLVWVVGRGATRLRPRLALTAHP